MECFKPGTTAGLSSLVLAARGALMVSQRLMQAHSRSYIQTLGEGHPLLNTNNLHSFQPVRHFQINR